MRDGGASRRDEAIGIASKSSVRLFDCYTKTIAAARIISRGRPRFFVRFARPSARNPLSLSLSLARALSPSFRGIPLRADGITSTEGAVAAINHV